MEVGWKKQSQGGENIKHDVEINSSMTCFTEGFSSNLVHTVSEDHVRLCIGHAYF